MSKKTGAHSNKRGPSKVPIVEEVEEEDEEDTELDQKDFLDAATFFQYQKAINILIDHLNESIEEIISHFTPSDQRLFTHADQKLILNAVLEEGFYEFCKFRLSQVAQSNAKNSEEMFLKAMTDIQGEIDLLAFLLVNSRMAHRSLNFDLYLSLLIGGLFEDILHVHEKIVQDMQEKKQKVNKESIKDIRIENLYI